MSRLPIVLDEKFGDFRPGFQDVLLRIEREVLNLAQKERGEAVAGVRERRAHGREAAG